MKTLENHVLIYDDNCPLCKAYTGAFVKTGMLDKNGREAYNQMPDETRMQLDLDRARNEIALIDRSNGKVLYGIDSLFRIIANRFTVLRPLFGLSLFRFMMKKLYSFISYNRKVIIPSRPAADACTPDMNLRWRWTYIVFSCLICASVLSTYSSRLQQYLPAPGYYREFLICAGQVLFQAIALYFIRKENIMNYLGNMMTVSLAGALLLLIFTGIAELGGITSPFVYLSAFGMVVTLMFFEHIRRMKLLGIHWIASVSWIVYRLIVLAILIY